MYIIITNCYNEMLNLNLKYISIEYKYSTLYKKNCHHTHIFFKIHVSLVYVYYNDD